MDSSNRKESRIAKYGSPWLRKQDRLLVRVIANMVAVASTNTIPLAGTGANAGEARTLVKDQHQDRSLSKGKGAIDPLTLPCVSPINQPETTTPFLVYGAAEVDPSVLANMLASLDRLA